MSSLTGLIEAHPNTRMIRRTIGQHANPMLLRTKFEVWRAEFLRRCEVAADAERRGALVQVGGPLGGKH
ncbi:hypothetical protein [Ruegeria sp. MALMAid1280]|uniref:hypothetical protein n=1 Tax=Ruegeria sp. MALMAid1280 TaxID=3411634 RepID=UPI003BA0889D